jgi:hypothetical protein
LLEFVMRGLVVALAVPERVIAVEGEQFDHPVCSVRGGRAARIADAAKKSGRRGAGLSVSRMFECAWAGGALWAALSHLM